ncbi:DUF1499 domain-containing protein [Geotalea sp. SG265]|uniref:DUF1499 domain-containing protein n=1 Tax=Geotalea sp. SG265 TaxID=2922867 RepID=UPI001FAF2B5F|nr:DUF1499 domain-containing protein [Geotalea sp. SG265]
MTATEAPDRCSVPRVLVLSGLGLAVAAGLVEISAGIGNRLGWWHFRTGFDLLRFSVYGGIAGALLAMAGGFAAGPRRYPAMSALAVLAAIVGLAVAAVPISFRIKAKQLPVIHDITTDTVHPPEFVAILPLRKEAPNPAAYGGPAVAEQQQKAYGDLRTEVLELPYEKAFTRALAAAREAGWKIVAAEPAAGRIEATDTTFWFGFTDDIVIRLQAAGARTPLDIRSVSRVGKSDVGKNAERIRSYLASLRKRQ